MRKQLTTVALVCTAQVTATGLGVAWGLGVAHRIGWLPHPWSFAGSLAVLTLVAEGLRCIASRRLRAATPVTPWLCMALGSYAMGLMVNEAFLIHHGDDSFIRGVLLLLPFLLAISPLVRADAWLGVAGSALFLATSLAMLTNNGFSRFGGSGFFESWVS